MEMGLDCSVAIPGPPAKECFQLNHGIIPSWARPLESSLQAAGGRGLKPELQLDNAKARLLFRKPGLADRSAREIRVPLSGLDATECDGPALAHTAGGPVRNGSR